MRLPSPASGRHCHSQALLGIARGVVFSYKLAASTRRDPSMITLSTDSPVQHLAYFSKSSGTQYADTLHSAVSPLVI